MSNNSFDTCKLCNSDESFIRVERVWTGPNGIDVLIVKCSYCGNFKPFKQYGGDGRHVTRAKKVWNKMQRKRQ